MTILERISGGNGCYLHTGTDEKVYDFEAFVVNEDCVISALSLGGVNVEETLNFKSNTLSAGMIVFAPTGQTFNSITLDSGSVILY
jgi:hypothetical protein